ncbi:MAG: FTR1 family iron permease [Candidatus Nitronauta litoralis]|uniref:FTR1 family iron permease n=1 Tax=Candidatus Nitronauta litoralis TaxID=2705533 RepID=A0A7T0BYM7_9BACT|nr:MAG: FTR1 family iron permease [Candidatus Nitronauta litoralis]
MPFLLQVMFLKRILKASIFVSLLLVQSLAYAEDSTESTEQTPAQIVQEIQTILTETQTAYKDKDSSTARLAAMDAYLVYEGIEPALINKDKELGKGLEQTFGKLQGQIKSDAPLEKVNTIIAELNAGLKKALPLLEEKMGFESQFINSFGIIVREGFEAILILAALITFLIKSKNQDKVRHIWIGVVLAVVASLFTAWLLETVFEMGAASREVMEGWIMLLAVVMLFWVSYWLVSKVEASKWQAYISGKMKDAIGTGNTFTLGMVAFISVYREGFETVLFYKALFIQAGESASGILPGFLFGCLVLVIVYFLIYKMGIRIPVKWFFIATSALLAFMAFMFMGKGLHELQMGNALSITPVTWAPEFAELGMYATIETFIGQVILLVAYIIAIAITLRSKLEGKVKPQTS